jgi:hypothetical protein
MSENLFTTVLNLLKEADTLIIKATEKNKEDSNTHPSREDLDTAKDKVDSLKKNVEHLKQVRYQGRK